VNIHFALAYSHIPFVEIFHVLEQEGGRVRGGSFVFSGLGAHVEELPALLH
jgi:hypothetical protein